jgi:hypothetical protein
MSSISISAIKKNEQVSNLPVAKKGIGRLPKELLIKIFSYISDDAAIKLVCKTWRKITIEDEDAINNEILEQFKGSEGVKNFPFLHKVYKIAAKMNLPTSETIGYIRDNALDSIRKEQRFLLPENRGKFGHSKLSWSQLEELRTQINNAVDFKLCLNFLEVVKRFSCNRPDLVNAFLVQCNAAQYSPQELASHIVDFIKRHPEVRIQLTALIERNLLDAYAPYPYLQNLIVTLSESVPPYERRELLDADPSFQHLFASLPTFEVINFHCLSMLEIKADELFRVSSHNISKIRIEFIEECLSSNSGDKYYPILLNLIEDPLMKELLLQDSRLEKISSKNLDLVLNSELERLRREERHKAKLIRLGRPMAWFMRKKIEKEPIETLLDCVPLDKMSSKPFSTALKCINRLPRHKQKILRLTKKVMKTEYWKDASEIDLLTIYYDAAQCYHLDIAKQLMNHPNWERLDSHALSEAYCLAAELENNEGIVDFFMAHPCWNKISPADLGYILDDLTDKKRWTIIRKLKSDPRWNSIPVTSRLATQWRAFCAGANIDTPAAERA